MIRALVPSLPNKTNYSTELVCSSGIMADFFQKQFFMSDAPVLRCPEFQSDLHPKGEHKTQALNSASDWASAITWHFWNFGLNFTSFLIFIVDR